jgi:hypothetical protein
MISSAPSCLNSELRLLRTRAAAARSFARRSPFAPVPTGVMTILPPSMLNETSLPGTTPAASRMRFGDGDLSLFGHVHGGLPSQFRKNAR